jgi:hypothetical protein
MSVIYPYLELARTMLDFIERYYEEVLRDEFSREQLEQMEVESRKIGQKAWDIGGLDQMRFLHSLIPHIGFARLVELQWSRIGTWRG